MEMTLKGQCTYCLHLYHVCRCWGLRHTSVCDVSFLVASWLHQFWKLYFLGLNNENALPCWLCEIFWLFSSGHKKDVPLTVLMFMLIFCLHWASKVLKIPCLIY